MTRRNVDAHVWHNVNAITISVDFDIVLAQCDAWEQYDVWNAVNDDVWRRVGRNVADDVYATVNEGVTP